MRAWGGRQFAIGCVFWYALFSAEPAAYMAALVALLARASSDVVQNALDGCYWKVGLFACVETSVSAAASKC